MSKKFASTLVVILTILVFLNSCDFDSASFKRGKALSYAAMQDSVQKFLDNYNKEFQKLLIVSAEAEWKLNTKIVEGDTITAKQADDAKKAMAAFTGSKFNIERAKEYLTYHSGLTSVQKRQLEVILFMAGSNPETAKAIVQQRIEAETQQTKNLFGFQFKINGKVVSTNDIDKILNESTNLKERQQAWEASKEVGVTLRDGLSNLQYLRNSSVQGLGYPDFFAYQASEYGMTSKEIMSVCQDMISSLWPLYREMHTWARYELAAKYNQDVPEYIPAHWLPNRWGQDWSALLDVKGINFNDVLKEKGAEWIVKKGEDYYVSLGFPKLPQTFYDKSSLYPVPEGANYKKNNHASAWHMDNASDVRSLMSIVPNTEWWETTLHELGHIYYYVSYSNKDVPIILRGGANRAYHEAMGTLMGLASMQKPFLSELGLVDKNVKVDEVQALFKEALNYVTVIPWGAGVMTGFEHELYANRLSKEQYNSKWWELVKKYQGIVPPTERGSQYCDAASKTHINDDPAQYYDYAMSNVLLFQFHEHIAKKILKQDPHSTNYWGNKEVGKFLQNIMYPGASVDWRAHLKANIGEDFSAKAMVNYFEPLLKHLKKVNAGRKYTLPEKI
jgi:peptidyl-dipeptidase A